MLTLIWNQNHNQMGRKVTWGLEGPLSTKELKNTEYHRVKESQKDVVLKQGLIG